MLDLLSLIGRAAIATVVATFVASTPRVSAQAPDTNVVDYRFAPPIWHTPVGLPGDWHKPLVDKSGALIYDFGPGPYARAATFVSVGFAADESATHVQTVPDPRVPVVRTEIRSANGGLTTDAFSVLPDEDWDAMNSRPYDGPVRRLNGVNSAVAWANPPGNVDPAFRSAAYGTNRPVDYRIRVAPGSRKRVALGFADPYRQRGSNVTRIMSLHVEGAPVTTLDVANEAGQNVATVRVFDASDDDGDGWLDISVKADLATTDANVFVSVIWVFAPDDDLDTSRLVRGELSTSAEVYVDCGREAQLTAFGSRTDVLHGTRTRGDAPLAVNVKTRRDLEFDEGSGTLTFFGEPFIVVRPRPESAQQTADGWNLALPRDAAEVAVSVLSGAAGSKVLDPRDAPQELARVATYWREDAGLPWGRIAVPDSGIQAIFDGSIRVMYQLLERVDGELQAQPGPSVYRGLWASNQPRVGRALTHLGAADVARASLAKTFSYQRDDGRILILTPPILLKETGLSMHAIHLHARMTRDRAFLEAFWPRLQRGADWIVQTSRVVTDTSAINYGLMPAGLSDGGVGGVVPEFTTNYWNLLALRGMADDARWLGRLDEAARYERQFAAYNASFRRAASRALAQDSGGNWFLPARMAFDPDEHTPQRSQSQFFHVVYPGRLFAKDDPLVAGNTAMLRAAPKAEGLNLTTGWLDGGVQPFVEATEASMWLYLGDVVMAQDKLYAVANHAAPTHVWVEEQLPGSGPRRSTGDVPHTGASSEYINLVRYLVAMEDGDHLDLLKGVPAYWWQPGATLHASDIPTRFGDLNLRVDVSDDGHEVEIELQPVAGPLGGRETGGVSLHLQSLVQRGYTLAGGAPLPDVWTVAWGRRVRLTLER